MRSLGTIIRAAVVLGLLSGAALADTVKFTVDMSPDQPGKPGKGSATLSVDTASKKLTMVITYSGLATAPAMAAFLSPPATQGGNPGTLPVPLPATVASPLNVTMVVTDPVIEGLKTGDWVLLLGTKQAPEIGGNVKPAP